MRRKVLVTQKALKSQKGFLHLQENAMRCAAKNIVRCFHFCVICDFCVKK